MLTRDNAQEILLRTAGHLEGIAEGIDADRPVGSVDAERLREYARQCREAAGTDSDAYLREVCERDALRDDLRWALAKIKDHCPLVVDIPRYQYARERVAGRRVGRAAVERLRTETKS